MGSVVDWANRVAPQWATLQFAALWQSALVVLALWIVSLLVRRWPPAVKYWLWQLAAIKLLVMPLWSVGLAVLPPEPVHVAAIETVLEELLLESSLQPTTKNQQPTTAPARRAEAHLSWQAWLLCAWLGVLLLQGVQLWVQRRRLGRITSACQPMQAQPRQQVEEAARALGLASTPRTLVTSEHGSPFVYGIVHPTLVISQSLLDELTAGQLRAVYLHELAHVTRRDLLWGWIPEIARRLYFFNPLAYWISYRVRLERELAADQLALTHGSGDAADYAETLVRVVTSASRGGQPGANLAINMPFARGN